MTGPKQVPSEQINLQESFFPSTKKKSKKDCLIKSKSVLVRSKLLSLICEAIAEQTNEDMDQRS